MKTVRSSKHRLHYPTGEIHGGQLVCPFDCPERWDNIIDRLTAQGYTEFVNPDELDIELVKQVHAPDLVEFLANAWDEWQELGMNGEAIPTSFPARRMRDRQIPKHIEGKLAYYCLSIETAITSGSWIAAKSAAACAVTAQNIVADDGVAFSLCRPPGHHAASDMYGAYCFLNNAAIAVQAFRNENASRVALLDIDFHHGNGSQDIFYQRDDVLYLSLHGHPHHTFPYFLGYADETGSGLGEGFNCNYPMPPGTDFETWYSALQHACNRIREYSPDALVVSHGVDTYKDDPMSFFVINSEDYIRCGELVGKLNLPTLFVMEGGYAIAEIGINTVNVLDGFISTSG